MLVIGRPDYAPVIGHVEGIAAAAGIQSGDRILRIDGDDILTSNDACRHWPVAPSPTL